MANRISTPTPKQVIEASALMYDFCVVAGIYKGAPKRPSDYEFIKIDEQECKKQITQLMHIVFERTNQPYGQNKDVFEDTNDKLWAAESLINFIASSALKFAVNDTIISVTKDRLCTCLAVFSTKNRLYWDDTAFTEEEMVSITSTSFGMALEKFGCFASQLTPATPAKNTSAAQGQAQGQSGTSATQGQATAGQRPGTGSGTYSKSGSHKADVPSNFLVTGQKIQLTEVYFIVADKIGANQPKVYVTPLVWDPNVGAVKIVSGSAASTVKFASANGWTDSVLYFKDFNAAAAFMNKLPALPAKIQNVRVVKQKSDPNGYFEVNTALGTAYIRAAKLNEEVLETLQEETDQETAKAADTPKNGYTIQDIDVYAEAFRRYD